MLSVAIYVNFFAHHYLPDMRLSLIAAAILLFGRTPYLQVSLDHRSMPMLVGLVLVSLFIWFAENIGTFSNMWLYPSQHHGWTIVAPGKLGAWFLLLIVSYALVSLINRPKAFVGWKRTKPAVNEPGTETV